jgi:para-nitrobenzyl esterase
MLFGESAGAIDTRILVASPLTAAAATAGHPLFWAAAIESGGGFPPLPGGYPSLATEQQIGATFAHAVGCSAPDPWACLLATPVATIVSTDSSAIGKDIDGQVLGTDVKTSFATNVGVPLLVGSNREETSALGDDPNTTFVSPDDYASYVRQIFPGPTGPDASILLSFYPQQAPNSILAQRSFDTDILQTLCPMRAMVRIAASKRLPVYKYLFTHALEDPHSTYDDAGLYTLGSLGAFHGEELTFIFRRLGKFIFSQAYRASTAELALSDAMIGYWTRFAATRNPNGGGGPSWIPYPAQITGSYDPEMVLDDAVQWSSGYHTAQCDYVAQWQ